MKFRKTAYKSGQPKETEPVWGFTMSNYKKGDFFNHISFFTRNSMHCAGTPNKRINELLFLLDLP